MRIIKIIFITALLIAASGQAAINGVTVTYDYVRKIAAERAMSPYKAVAQALPSRLAALTYEDYRSIQFRTDQSLWRPDGLPFQLGFFHRGGLFPDKVTIHEFT